MFNSKEKKVTIFKMWHTLLLGGILVIALIVQLSTLYYPKAWVKIKDNQYRVLVSNTPQRWVKGLSDRADLGGYDGMLFVFSTRESHAMVMRRMQFPLDILWIQGDTIVDMAPNLQPDTGQNEADLRVYQGRLPSDMVLEFPAGFITNYGLKVGDEVVVAR